MIRITRSIHKTKIYDLLKLENVSKIEIKQRKQKNFSEKEAGFCKVYIYLTIDGDGDSIYHKNLLDNILKWAKSNNPSAESTAHTARIDRFITEVAFNNIKYPFPGKYKELCEKYSQEFFINFNM